MGAAPTGKATRLAVLLAAALLLNSSAATPALAFTESELRAARGVMAGVDHGKWAEARQYARQSGFPLLAKLAQWLDLTHPGSTADFGEITHFLDQNQDWPYQGLLKKRAEEALNDSTPPGQILDWFQRNAPQSPAGATHYIDLLQSRSQMKEAEASARQFLVDGSMTGAQLAIFADRYGAMLRPADFQLRVDRLIWAGDADGATQILSYVSAEDRAIDRARIAFATQAANAQALYDQLSERQQNDLALIYERMRWLRRQDRDADAIQLLSLAPPAVPHPDLWANERTILARRALAKGNARQAYDLARDHRQADGSALADGEWLAGWIALRFLDEPKQALAHFELMLSKVDRPISVARAAYWAGRAEDALGDKPAAERYYARASKHIGTFYGQMALARLNPSARLALPPQPSASGLEARVFNNRELVQVAELLAAIGLSNRADPFVRRIGELARTPDEALLAMRLAKTTNSLAAEVLVAKKLMQGGIQLLADGYPVISHLGPKAPEPALIHAIIRQESLFDAGAVSPSGALGLMQLMPATARNVAGKLKVKKHKTELLTADPRYNVTLGSSYLDELVGRFNGSYVMAVAGYNAGPGRVAGWIRDNGDPRQKLDDTIDWIEKISVYETRNYVQRVIENLQIYRARLDGGSAPNLIVKDLTR